ncbi:MAG TPA: hypothetical protein P5191_06440 [Ruminococcus sp.]|nr:hypothetical protein [Ruminococcus sp.]
MSSNKEIGFDILENSDLDSVEEIGTDNMNIDKNARDRMLKITMDKYSAASGKQMNSQKVPETMEYAEQVSGTEMIQHRRLSRIIGFAACSAAAVALIAGGMFLYKHNASPENTVSDPAGEVIVTTAAESTATEPESEGIDVNANYIFMNPYTDRTDITQEELDAACMRYLDSLSKDRSEIWDIGYSFNDINHDDIPELFVRYSANGGGGEKMFVYDGKEYKSAHFNSSVSEHETVENNIGGDVINICPEKNLIYVSTEDIFTGHNFSKILWLDKRNTAATAFELNDSGYYIGGVRDYKLSDPNDTEARDKFEASYYLYNWQDLEYTPYDEAGENTKKTETTKPEDDNKSNGALITDSLFIAENPDTDRTDITQEELDAARKRVKEDWYNTDELEDNDMEYAYADVNGDGIPELFIKEYTLSHGYVQSMLVYTGEEYRGAYYYIDFKGSKHNDIDGAYFGQIGGNIDVYGNIMICPEKNLIHLNEGGDDLGTILKFEKGNIMKTLYKYSYDVCYEGGVEVSHSVETADRFQAALDSCNWQELEYTPFD